MKIVSISISSFGKLQDFSFNLEKGVNVFQQPNSFGKSTMAAFIRAMLYGLNYNYKTIDGNRVNDVTKYMPWNSTQKFGGSMEIEHEGNVFLIERYFGSTAKQESIQVINKQNGKILTLDCQIGEYFLGLTAESYDRSTFIPQDAVEISSNENFDTKLANFVQDTSVDYQQVQDKIRAYKKTLQYEKGKGGLIYLADQECSKLERQLGDAVLWESQRQQKQLRLAQVKQQIEQNKDQQAKEQNQLQQLQKQLYQSQPSAQAMEQKQKYNELKQKIQALPKEIDQDKQRCDELYQQITDLQNAPKTMSKRSKLAITFVAILLVVVGVLLALQQFVLAGVSALIVTIVAFWVLSKQKGDGTKNQIEQLTSEYLQIASKYVYTQSISLLDVHKQLWELHSSYQQDLRLLQTLGQLNVEDNSQIQMQLQNQIEDLQIQLENLKLQESNLQREKMHLEMEINQPYVASVEIAEKLQEQQQLLLELKDKFQTATRTSEILEIAKEKLSSAYLPKLCQKTQQLLCAVTQDNYVVTTDRTFNVSLTYNKVTKPLSSFSRGIKEITVLCFRIALSQLLYQDDIPFIIIDDAFVNFDEQNFVRATALLNNLSANTQVIYFTCHNRLGKLNSKQ